MTTRPIIVWLRNDLRLADNPALSAAVADGGPVLPVYILEDSGRERWAMGAASRWWLRRSLESLTVDLAGFGASLTLRRGTPAAVLAALAAETGAAAVHWGRRTESAGVERDQAAEAALRARGIEVRVFASALLFEPASVRTGTSRPYGHFGAFWRACLSRPAPPRPLPAPARIPAPASPPASEALDAWGLAGPGSEWSDGLAATWQPGEAAAQARLAWFVDHALDEYGSGRDLPSQDGTSRLSPHLHHGEISPRQVWHRVIAATGSPENPFLRELAWREFCHYLLHHHEDMAEQPLRREFADFPWAWNETLFRAWSEGRTGYPIVDAGMRALLRTGWMHNRVRMIAASFLVKDLLVPWQRGEAWFWETLVDADLAANAFGWQWVAGCGADAAPYFRIFNPALQGSRFDPDGAYVRRWVPELAEMPPAWIHRPWEAPEEVLANAGVRLGETYPRPVVDHKAARQRALMAYDRIKVRA